MSYDLKVDVWLEVGHRGLCKHGLAVYWIIKKIKVGNVPTYTIIYVCTF